DGDGNILLLAEQDRARWDQSLVGRGIHHLDRSTAGDQLSEYHVQAGIAAVHATSPSFDETDWSYLLSLYDQLLAIAPSPVATINRAIALWKAKGAEAALLSLEELTGSPELKRYYLLPAVRADLLRRLGRSSEASIYYREALSMPCTEPERRFLSSRL